MQMSSVFSTLKRRRSRCVSGDYLAQEQFANTVALHNILPFLKNKIQKKKKKQNEHLPELYGFAVAAHSSTGAGTFTASTSVSNAID